MAFRSSPARVHRADQKQQTTDRVPDREVHPTGWAAGQVSNNVADDDQDSGKHQGLPKLHHFAVVPPGFHRVLSGTFATFGSGWGCFGHGAPLPVGVEVMSNHSRVNAVENAGPFYERRPRYAHVHETQPILDQARHLSPSTIYPRGVHNIPGSECSCGDVNAVSVSSGASSWWDLGAHESRDRGGGFVDFGFCFVSAGLDCFADAVAEVFIDKSEGHCFESFGGGRDLGKDVDTVRVFRDHASYPAYLALYPLQSFDLRVLGVRVPG